MKTIEQKELFYATCAEILGVEHKFAVPPPRRTRWNTRNLGNGRFPGFGLVQCFGSGVRMISKQHGTKVFSTYEETYEFLRKCAE